MLQISRNALIYCEVLEEIFCNNVLILAGSLFFNPTNYKIYDYVNGVRDIRKNKVIATDLHLYLITDSAVSWFSLPLSFD